MKQLRSVAKEHDVLKPNRLLWSSLGEERRQWVLSFRRYKYLHLLKNRPPIELINSLRAVKDGIIQIDPMVARKLLHTDHAGDSESAMIVEGIRMLTGREREVLHLIAQALDNRQIAEHLNVTEQTARNYVSSPLTR